MKTQTQRTAHRIPGRAVLWLAALILCLAPVLAQADPVLPPPAYGLYLQQGNDLIRLNYLRARRVPVGEMGYVMGIMHRTRVFLSGERSELRTANPQPILYSYGANPADFYSLVKLERRHGLREFQYSIYSAGGSAKVVDEYLVGVKVEQAGKDLYRMTPAQALEPGEYGIVLGDSICPFGIDR
ncbi:MAG TPA: hypothetical protein VGB21_05695 [Candidatus Methylomirabilis sp.]